jgi:hypothetical protein
MRREAAEILALKALAWLAGNNELLPIFLGSTGASLDDLKNRAIEPDFLGSMLDFILMDDAWVLEFAAAEKVPPETLLAARQALPGGEAVHWT